MRALPIVVLLIGSACGSVSGIATTTTAPPPASTTTIPPQVVPEPSCPLAIEFASEGRIFRLDQPTSDTGMIGLISWDLSPGCESFRIDFETTEGAPSTTAPSVIVEYLDTRQVIRVYLDVDRTVITDQRVETELVDRLYVVRGLDGGMFIDFHLAKPAEARARITNSPAQLTLQFQPGNLPFEGTAALSEYAVVIEPSDGSVGSPSIRISGYARTFEANVLIIATAGDRVVAETNAVAADWVETWGEFQTRLDVPLGETSIFVGESDPKDGSLAGVTIRMTNRP